MAFLVALDGGPAFYSQNRVGFKGRIFRCWKLRTMVVDADRKLADYLALNPSAREEWDRTQKLRNDPRITWIGHAPAQVLPRRVAAACGTCSLAT